MAGRSLSATWRKIHLLDDNLHRSSHIISTIGKTAYIFSGELKPREPVAPGVLQFDLSKCFTEGSSEPLTVVSADAAGGPPARVGAAGAAVGEKLYVFGGRGGKAMNALEEGGAVWAFDGKTQSWTELRPAEGSPIPPARSYHTAAAKGENLYIHAGCTASDRLSDLWAFNTKSREWKCLQSAPGNGRGGTSLAALGRKLYRMNGFDGKNEVGGSIDCYDISHDFWTTTVFSADGISGPGARSVSALVPVSIGGTKYLVTLFGERGPSDRGHEGAGQFWDDVWAYAVKDRIWTKVDTSSSAAVPQERGWFDADAVKTGEGREGVVLQGGLNNANERIGDMWILEF